MRSSRSLLVVALLYSAATLHAPPAAAQPVAVKHAWVRAPAPGQNIAAAYMELTSKANLLLVGVASPVAARAELHSSSVEQGVMKMRPVERIELPSGKPVKLAPGGLHVMLIELKQPLRSGAKVPLTLTVQRADLTNRSVFTVQAEVRSAPPEPSHHH